MRFQTILLSALFSLTGLAQTPYSLEDILHSAFPSSLTVDAAGKRLAWVADTAGIRNIYVAEAAGFGARRVTDYDQDDGRALRIVGLTPGGEHIVYVRDGRFNPNSDVAGSGSTQMLVVPFRGGEPAVVGGRGSAALSPVKAEVAYTLGGSIFIKDLTGDDEAQKVADIRGNPGKIQFSPDGRRLVFQVSRESHHIGYAFIGLLDRDKQLMHYIDPAVYGDDNPQFSPDGKRLLFVRQLKHHDYPWVLGAKTWPINDPWQIRVHDFADGTTHTVWQSPEHDTLAFADVQWLDKDHIAFISEHNGWRNLYSVPASGGKVTDLAVGPFIVEALVTHADRNQAWYVTNAEDIDRRHIWQVDASGKRKQLTTTDIEWSPRPLASGGLAWLGAGAKQPATVFVRTKGKTKMVVKNPENFPAKHLITPQQVVFQATDGVTVHGQLFEPPASVTGKRPALMFFHGGPIRQMLLGFHYGGYYHKTYAMNQYLASRGYVVLSVNYRLGVGYGRAFRDVPDGGPRGASEYRDLLAGAAFLRKHQRVDPERMGLWGGSYGGLMTALGLARNSDLFAAGVDLHGVHDWNQWQAFVSGEDNDHNRIEWASSPIANIESWRSPVLLIHGDDDRNVNFSETIWLTKTLKAQGVDVELMVLPDEVHSFLRHENWLKVFAATADFFERKLKP